MAALIALLLVALGASRTASSDDGGQPECLANQFYYEPLANCRNCSDIGHLFHSYQDWLGAEVVSNSKAPNLDTSKRKFGADGEVLSRLIGPLDSSTSSDLADSANDESDQGTSNQMATNEDGDDHRDSSSDTDELPAKQIQRLVARFLMAPTVGSQLLEAVEQCRHHQNQSACQMWSNLCVATMYSYSDSASGPAPAPSSAALRLSSSSSSSQGRKLWQQCEQFSLNSVCNSLRDWWRLERKPNSVDILNIFAADEPLSSKAIASSGLQLKLNQPIQLLAYKYTFHGHFIGVDQFGLGQVERFCLGRSGSSASSKFDDANNRELLRVGKSMELRCELESGASLGALHLNETVFTDLYLGYQQNGAFFVKPVPILIKNLLYNGQQINRKHPRDPTRWKLVHRFLFHSVLELDNRDEALVYAKSVQLDLKFKRQDKGMLLSSILLSLDYDYVISGGSSNIKNHSYKQPITEITISQALMDMLSYRKDLDLVVTILSIISCIWSMLKCYHIQKCHGLVRLDLESLFRFFLISCDTLANLFSLVSLTFAGLLFFALKFQMAPSSVQVLGPSHDLEDALIFNIQLAFVFKLIGLAHILYNPLQADIFFIDWERPKMLTSAEILQHFSHYNHSNSKQQPSASSDARGSEQQQNQNHLASISAAIQQQHQQFQSAGSFWRPYTIVNKWLQMQTFRRQDTTLQLFLFVCFVNLTQVLQLATVEADYLTPSTPSSSFRLKPSSSRAFRLFLLSTIYLGLSGAQVLVKKYVLEPMFGNKVHEFVDLCSVANVSLFCMLYPKFGYYLHGRNANGSGECGIAEINALLEREERDLCSKRGLAPNSDQQSFVLILPRIINDHYRKLSFRDRQRPGPSASASPSGLLGANKQSLLRSMLSLSLSPAPSQFGSQLSSTFSHHRSHMETVADRNKAINQFLVNFLEHVYKDIDYSIRERRKFESSFLSGDMDYDDELGLGRGQNSPRASTGLSNGHLGGNNGCAKPTPATFCKDPGNSFTALIWLGHEWHLILFELLTILLLDFSLDNDNSNSLAITTVGLVWSIHQLLKRFYVLAAKRNLVTKALLDEKFLAT